jgi:hypothetical protein
MADETVVTAPPALDPANIDIQDYIVASSHIDKFTKSTVALGHQGDYVTIAVTQKAADHMAVPLDRLIVRFKFWRMKDGAVKRTNDLDFNKSTASVTTTNDEDPSGADVNVYVSIKEISLSAVTAADGTVITPAQTIQPAGGDIDVAPPKKDEFPWVWVAVAIAVIAVVAVILLLYMRSGHTAPAGLPAAAPSPVIVVTPAVA